MPCYSVRFDDCDGLGGDWLSGVQPKLSDHWVTTTGVLNVVFIPLPSEPYDGDGRLKVFAQYNSVGDELHFDQIHKQVTKD